MNDSVTILLVDDEPLALKLEKDILGENFGVQTAESTKEALEMTRDFEPHVKELATNGVEMVKLYNEIKMLERKRADTYVYHFKGKG